MTSADAGHGTADHQLTDVLSAWAGLIAVALFVVGSLVAGSAPRPDATMGDVTAFLVQQRSALLLGTALIFLSIPFFGCFIGLLGGVLRAAEGGRAPLTGAATLGWTVLLTIASIGILAQAALVWRGADQTDPAVVRFVFDVGSLSLYSAGAMAVALSVGATSVVIYRTRLLPRWIALLGLAEVLVNVVELAGLGSRDGLNAAGYAAGIGPFLWSLWVAATAISLARTVGRQPVDRPASTSSATASR